MTAPSQTPEAAGLEACPFCGGTTIMTYSQAITEGPDFYWHKCGDCGAETEGDYGQDEAAAVWNRRVTAASAQTAIDAEKAKVAELEGALITYGVAAEYRDHQAAQLFDRATAAEARADRLAKDATRLLAEISSFGRAFMTVQESLSSASTPDAYDDAILAASVRYQSMVKTASALYRAALQQETQP